MAVSKASDPLGWHLTGARLAKDTLRQQEAQKEQQGRGDGEDQPISDDSLLPDARTVLTRHSP